jgi:hypothetical protein
MIARKTATATVSIYPFGYPIIRIQGHTIEVVSRNIQYTFPGNLKLRLLYPGNRILKEVESSK